MLEKEYLRGFIEPGTWTLRNRKSSLVIGVGVTIMVVLMRSNAADDSDYGLDEFSEVEKKNSAQYP